MNIRFNKNLFFILLYAFVMLTVFVMLLYRCRYGVCNTDETFFLAVPYRMCQGDALFLNEWNPAQMMGLLLYPAMKLFLAITKSTFGIAITFRYLYVVIQFLTSILLFILYRKFSAIGAAVGSIIFFIFAPYGIIALSYNSMCIIFLTISLTIFSTLNKNYLNVLSGVFFSFSVLCCPFLVLLFILYLFGVFFVVITNKQIKLLNFKKFAYFTFGIIIIFIIFCIYVFKHMSLNELLDVLPNILNVSPSHTISFIDKIKELFSIVGSLPILTKLIFVTYFLTSIVGYFSNDTKIKYICYVVIVVITLFNIINIVFVFNYLNHLMFVPLFMGVSIYLIYCDNRVDCLFYGVCLPTIIYCFCAFLGSDQYLYIISSAASVSSVAGSVITVATFNNQCSSKGKNVPIRLSLIALAVFEMLSVTHFRMNKVYWEDNIKDQTILVNEGINRGLLISPERYQVWNDTEFDVSNNIKSSKVLFLTSKNWLYLINGYENCSYSAWYNHASPLIEYYRINPNKLPNEIYIEKDYIEEAKPFLSLYYYIFYKTTDLGSYVYKRCY